MKKLPLILGAALLALAVHGAAPVIPPGKLAVFECGGDPNFPMITARVAPCYVQIFDPVTNFQVSPIFSLEMSTNASVPGSVWINAHAGSEGGGLSRSVDRQFLALEGYTGNILSPTAAKPSTDQTVYRGIVTVDAFTNTISVYSDLAAWFGIPAGSATGTQDNPTGIATTDGTNFWGTGNFAGTSSELDGTLFYNGGVEGAPYEIQNYIQAAGEARVIGGTLYIAVKPATGVTGGIYNFIDPENGNVVPLPYDPTAANPYQRPAFTNLFINWGTTFKNILNFDMNPQATVAYGADQTFGIVKFTNNGAAWVPAPYYFSATNIGTLKQTSGNQGIFGICVDFSGTNPVIYATTMENGTPTNYPGGFGVNTQQGHQNNNRIIMVVDTGVNPGTNYVAQTLAVAPTTNGFYGGIDFSPDLRPLITSNPSSYSTTNGGSAAFSVTDQCVFPTTFQWLQNSTNAPQAGNTSPTLTLDNLSTDSNGFTYQCVVSDQYGSVTSTPAILTVTATPVAPVITSPTNHVTSYINGTIAFGAVTATGTQPFSYQWYFGTTQLTDGAKYVGSTSSSLMISNLAVPGDSGNYYVVVSNSAGYASNLADVLTVKYFPVSITPGQPSSVTTFVGLTTSLTANSSGGTAPITNQWYKGTTALSDTGDYSGTTTPTLTISPAHTNDTASNYYIVVSNPAGSVTSSVASVTVIVPPPLSSVSYSNQVYFQNFDSLPDPGGVSVNSFNNPGDPGNLNGVAYSLANPFDFNYPVILQSYVGGLGLSAMKGWYGAADTLYTGVDGITRFGAQDGDQSTGGVIDFGPNDVNGGVVGTNRALGLISTSTTGSTSFGLKLVNTSGGVLNYINVSFIGEYWRNNSGARTMSFGYTNDIGATNFVLTSEAISNCTPVEALSFSFAYDPLGNLAVDGTQSSNQVNLAVSNLALSSPWNPGDALWLIWSIEYYGSGGGQGYAIDNLAFAASADPVTAPVATTTAASAVTAGTAALNGTVNPSNAPTAYWFEYGTTTAYGKFSPTNVLAPGSSTVAVSSSISGLLQGTGYHYQLVATNFAGRSLGGDLTFTTLPVTPPQLGGASYGGGKFSLSFTNATGASFSVLGTNNLAVPLNKWPVVGHTVENPLGSGMYYYTNSSATNAPFFYRLRQP